jgi:hypothetical protein
VPYTTSSPVPSSPGGTPVLSLKEPEPGPLSDAFLDDFQASRDEEERENSEYICEMEMRWEWQNRPRER